MPIPSMYVYMYVFHNMMFLYIDCPQAAVMGDLPTTGPNQRKGNRIWPRPGRCPNARCGCIAKPCRP